MKFYIKRISKTILVFSLALAPLYVQTIQAFDWDAFAKGSLNTAKDFGIGLKQYGIDTVKTIKSETTGQFKIPKGKSDLLPLGAAAAYFLIKGGALSGLHATTPEGVVLNAGANSLADVISLAAGIYLLSSHGAKGIELTKTAFQHTHVTVGGGILKTEIRTSLIPNFIKKSNFGKNYLEEDKVEKMLAAGKEALPTSAGAALIIKSALSLYKNYKQVSNREAVAATHAALEKSPHKTKLKEQRKVHRGWLAFNALLCAVALSPAFLTERSQSTIIPYAVPLIMVILGGSEWLRDSLALKASGYVNPQLNNVQTA